jgi:hypothetical protein
VPVEACRDAFAESVIPPQELLLETGLEANLEDEADGN